MRSFLRFLLKGLRALFAPAIIAVCLICFVTALSNLSSGREEEGRARLEDSIRRASVACYAAEGIYPPDVEYLREHYGVQIDDDHYAVFYEIFGSNIMPQITVVEK